MYAWVRGVASPELGQQSEQMLALGRLQIGAKFLLDADGEPECSVQEPTSGGGENDRVGAPVGGVRAASNEPLSLQLIYQPHHAVGMQVQAVTDGPLTLAVRHRQCPQKPEMPWLDAQRLESRCELAAYLVAEPRHGERDARRRFRRACRVMTVLTWHDAELISDLARWRLTPRQHLLLYCCIIISYGD
jgi:hypothetical protein